MRSKFSTSLVTAAKIFLTFSTGNVVFAQTGGFLRQTIAPPHNTGASCFADVNNDRRSDFFSVDWMERKVLVYRQSQTGFTNAPDQAIELPPQTAWIAPCDVDAQPGLELLMSTTSGLFYHRQNQGAFESELRTLVKADQVFTNDDSPGLISLATNSFVPVITATQAVLYQRNAAFEWKSDSPVPLEAKEASWSGYRNEWIMGPNSSYGLRVGQSFRAKSKKIIEGPPNNDAIKKLSEDLRKVASERRSGTNRMDLNGDGRMDVVLWQIVGEMDYRTDVYVFLRAADGKLPERPSQILHCRGIPIPIGSTYRSSPIADLKGDGTYQLVLLELKTSVTSASGLVEMALTRGVDLGLTIRTFHNGIFSGSADATIIVRVILTSESLEEWPMFVCGDYNGDGRPDFVVRRSADQWNIVFSTADGNWFRPEPAMTFETPVSGSFEINDLNGDGRSDIVLRARNDPRLFIFLTQPMKGKP